MHINENEMNKGYKVFYFCYSDEINKKLEETGVKPILKALTLKGKKFSLYWQSNKVKKVLNDFNPKQ